MLLKSVFLIAIVAVAMIGMMVPSSFADHPEVAIVTVDESGFGTDCAEAQGGPGCYVPLTATVEVGGVVTMTNTDPTGVHTYTSGTVDGFTPSPDGTFDTGVLMQGDAFEWIPETAGEQPYYCMLHTWMIGTIIVQEAHADDNVTQLTINSFEIYEDGDYTRYRVTGDAPESTNLTFTMTKPNGSNGDYNGSAGTGQPNYNLDGLVSPNNDLVYGTWNLEICAPEHNMCVQESFTINEPVTLPDDGAFTLPCSMQENGDGVWSSSCNGFYSNGIARAEVGVNYGQGILPIQNYQAVGFFIDENGNQGSNIIVNYNLINPGDSPTLVFENTVSGFVSNFQMQMLGGDLVVENTSAAAAEAAAAEAAAAEAAADVPLMVMISDSAVMGGTQVEIEFNKLHVNYNINATQNGEVVFEETGLHSMELIATHQIDAVGSDEDPIDVEVVSLGIGAPGNENNWTGPVGQVTTVAITSGAQSAPVTSTPVASNTITTVNESGFSQSCVDTGCYTPLTAVVNYGDTVTMINTDPTGVHTYTSGTVNGFSPTPSGIFDSGVMMSGDSFQWQANVSGEVPYYCMLHTWMVGTIVVQGESQTDITFTNPRFVDAFGNSLNAVSVDQQIHISADLINNNSFGHGFAYDVKIIESTGHNMGYYNQEGNEMWITGYLSPGQSFTPGIDIPLTWTPLQSGTYIVEFSLYDTIDGTSGIKGNKLAPSMTMQIVVGNGIFVPLQTLTPEPVPEPTVDTSNDNLTITGSITNYDSQTTNSVTWTVKSPNGNIVAVGEITPNTKYFYDEVTLDGPLMQSTGTYTIEARWGYSVSSTSTFYYEPGVGAISRNIILQNNITPEPTTELQYGIFSVEGVITNYNESPSDVTFRIQSPNGLHIIAVDQVTPNSNGKFSTQFNVSNWKDNGYYSILVGYGSQQKEMYVLVEGGMNDGITKRISFVNNIITTPEPVNTNIITTTPGSAFSTECASTSQGCFLPKIASVSVGSIVTFSNTDNSMHTFTSGNPSDDVIGTEFNSGMLSPGESATWTPTEAGEFPYFDMIHPWMQGTIIVQGSGPVVVPQPVPQPVSLIDLDISMSKTTYDLGDLVGFSINGNNFSGTQNVSVDVTDPRGNTVVSRSINISPNTSGEIEFRLSEGFKTGTYKITVTTSDNGKTISEKSYFKLQSQFNSFTISDVMVSDQQGNSSTLHAGEMGFIKVNLSSTKSIGTLVTVNLFDAELTSIGIGSVQTTLASGESEIILSFMIPDNAAIGPADIYVNAFSDWPSNGGTALTGELASMEDIS